MTNKFRDRKDKVEIPQVPKYLLWLYRATFHACQLTNDRLKKIGFIYWFVNRYTAWLSKFSVCSRGCNACCHIPVQITKLEAEFISHKTGAQLKFRPLAISAKKTACPFLKSGVCSIYKFRPFNCRTFHTLDDPKYCKTNVQHQVYGSASLGYSNKMLLGLSNVLKSLNDSAPTADIREFFQ